RDRPRLDDRSGDVARREGPRGTLPAAREAGRLRLTGAVCVPRARDRQADLPGGAPTRGAGIPRADGARRCATAAAGKRVESRVLAERAEHVHLVGQVDRGLRDRTGIEDEGDRQCAEARRRRRRTVVAGRIVAIDTAVARRARQGVIDAGVALVRGGAADRAGLNERPEGAAWAVCIVDAA